MDATCPFVAKIHQIVKEYSEQGRLILVAGDKKHPEVKGIVGFCCSEAVVFKHADELEEMTKKKSGMDKAACYFGSANYF